MCNEEIRKATPSSGCLGETRQADPSVRDRIEKRINYLSEEINYLLQMKVILDFPATIENVERFNELKRHVRY